MKTVEAQASGGSNPSSSASFAGGQPHSSVFRAAKGRSGIANPSSSAKAFLWRKPRSGAFRTAGSPFLTTLLATLSLPIFPASAQVVLPLEGQILATRPATLRVPLPANLWQSPASPVSASIQPATATSGHIGEAPALQELEKWQWPQGTPPADVLMHLSALERGISGTLPPCENAARQSCLKGLLSHRNLPLPAYWAATFYAETLSERTATSQPLAGLNIWAYTRKGSREAILANASSNRIILTLPKRGTYQFMGIPAKELDNSIGKPQQMVLHGEKIKIEPGEAFWLSLPNR